MELTQLKYFKKVAEKENITKAAEELHTSQPALSKSLKSLEQELGFSLFDRINKHVRLNSYGQIVLQYTNNIYQEISEMQSALEKQKIINVLTSIKLISPSIDAVRFFKYLILQSDLNIGISAETVPQNKLSQLILNNTADVAVSLESIHHPDLSCVEFGKDNLAFIVPQSHPLANHSVISLKDLDQQKILYLLDEHDSHLDHYFFQALQASHIHPDFLFEKDPTVFHFMGKNLHYPRFTSTFGLFEADVYPSEKLLKFDKASQMEVPFYLVYKKKENPNLSSFLSWLRSNADELSENPNYIKVMNEQRPE